MRPFEYSTPTKTDQVPALLGKSWGEVEILAGGSDLLSLMKDEITTPKRLVNIKQVAGLHAISNEGGALQLGTLVTLDRIGSAAQVQQLDSWRTTVSFLLIGTIVFFSQDVIDAVS